MQIRNIILGMDCFQHGGEAILTQVSPACVYENGKRLDKIEGLRVTVAFPAAGYDTLTVKVSDPVDRLSAVLANSNGKPVYVEFENFQARIYQIDGAIRVSAKADAVAVVEKKEGGLDDIVL